MAICDGNCFECVFPDCKANGTECLKLENEFKKTKFNYDYEIDSSWRYCTRCHELFFGGYKSCDTCRAKARAKEKEKRKAKEGKT